MHRPRPLPAAPGQESVWDYPRPPRLERTPKRLLVVLGGETIADTVEAFRVLETGHPPVYYLPPSAFAPGALTPGRARGSFCEWKGWASYFSVRGGGQTEQDAAWAYPQPAPGFEAMAGYVALYAGRVDRCTVDGEPVTPQPGGFYGGWITSDVVGPFKGGPGSMGW